MSNIRRAKVGNYIIDHSDVVGACRRCFNYIFIVELTPGFNRLGNGNHKAGRETFKFWDLVRFVLEIWRDCFLCVF